MDAKYFSLEEAIELIDEPNRAACYRLLEENRELFEKARGSKSKHQAWEGGYLDHIKETMNIAIALYDPLNKRRPLEFSLSDALLVLFLHDVEKPWKHVVLEDRVEDSDVLRNKLRVRDFRDAKIAEYGFELTAAHQNGLQYVEGEHQNYDPHVRMQGPLAAFAHACDNISARVWYDHPKESDSWAENKAGGHVHK